MADADESLKALERDAKAAPLGRVYRGHLTVLWVQISDDLRYEWAGGAIDRRTALRRMEQLLEQNERDLRAPAPRNENGWTP